MNQTIEDSKGYDVVCMSFGKEKGKGIDVVEAGKKDSFLIETMEIKLTNCTAQDMRFSKEQMGILQSYRNGRRTRKALEQSKAMGR